MWLSGCGLTVGKGGVQCAGAEAEPHQGAQDGSGVRPRSPAALEGGHTHAQSSGESATPTNISPNIYSTNLHRAILWYQYVDIYK